MEGEITTSVDSSRAQEIQHKNPVEQTRRPTDILFMLAFSIFMPIWLVILISASCTQQSDDPSDLAPREVSLFIKGIFSSLRFEHIIVFIISTILNTSFILLGILLSTHFTKVFFYLILGIYALFIVSVGFKLLLEFPFNADEFESSDLFRMALDNLGAIIGAGLLLKAMFMMASVICFFKVDHKEIFNVVKDFCRVILGSPLLILFVGSITILGHLVLLFAVNAICTVLSSDRILLYTNFNIHFLVLGNICVLSFIDNFASMVISEYAVNYHWTKRDKPAIGESISRTLKNHVGTIMFSSLPCVPFICAIVRAAKHSRSPRNRQNYFVYLASKVFLVLNVECFTLIVSSIYGTGFVRSLKKALDTVLRRCLLYLATCGVIEAITGIITAIAAGLTVSILIVSSIHYEIDLDEYMAMSSLYGLSLSPVIFGRLMHLSSKALLINRIIILNEEEQCNEGKIELINP